MFNNEPKKSFLFPILTVGGLLLVIIILGIVEEPIWNYFRGRFTVEGEGASKMADNSFFALLKITKIILWMIMVIVAVRFVNGIIFKARRDTETPQLIQNIFSIVIYIVAFFLIFKSQYPNVDLAALFTTSAIFGVIIGLALQDTLGNLFAGLSAQADQPFSVGDVINIPQKGTGVVESITWRGVKIRTFQNRILIISHSVLSKDAIEVAPKDNLNARLIFFSTVYTESPAHTIQVVREAVRHVENVSPKMRPIVRIRALGTDGIDWEIKYWLEDYAKYNETDALIRQRVWYACFREDIRFPYPTRTLHIERRPKEAETYSDANEIFDRLSAIEIFAPLSDEETSILVNSSSRRVFAPNELILRSGDSGSSMFVVNRGSVKVQIIEKDKPKTVATLTEGEFFGEMGLFTGEPRTANVVAAEETEVLEIAYPAMKRLFETNPDLVESMSQKIAERRLQPAAENNDAPPPAEAVKAGIFTNIKRFFGLS